MKYMENERNEFHHLVRDIRKSNKIKAKEISEYLKITLGQYYEIESIFKRRSMSLDIFNLYIKFLEEKQILDTELFSELVIKYYKLIGYITINTNLLTDSEIVNIHCRFRKTVIF